MTAATGQFGTIDLNTGAFTQLGSSISLRGLGEADGNLYAVDSSTLYQVNPANGSLTAVGNGSILFEVLGSTTSGLFVLDQTSLNLYSLNPKNGATTLVGPTGLSRDGVRAIGLSAGSGTLYLALGNFDIGSTTLYSLNTATGAATTIGKPSALGIGAMVFENGTLYAGTNFNTPSVYTLNPTTFVANTSGGLTFNGLAPIAPCQVSVTPSFQCKTKWAANPYNFEPSKQICDVGCTLSDLAMAVNTARAVLIPTFTQGLVPTDPGSLNEFMIEHGPNVEYVDDGTKATGNVRIETATRDVGLATLFEVGNPLYFDDSLKGVDSTVDLSQARQKLGSAICQGHPVVVEVASISKCVVQPGPPGGHYVLVTGKQLNSDGSTKFLIVDPGCRAFKNLEDVYNDQFVIRGFVSDPAGDVSGLDVDVGDVAELLVANASGQSTGFDPSTGNIVKQIPQSAYSRDFLTDNNSGAVATGITHTVDIFQPSQTTYSITVEGLQLGTYSLFVAPFSQDGSAQPRSTIPGISAPGSASSYQIQFSSTPGAVSRVALVASFQGTLADVSNGLQLGLIDNQGIANSLSAKINAASDAEAAGNFTAAMNILNAFKNEVSAQTSKHITGIAPQVLMEDADSLLAQLNGVS